MNTVEIEVPERKAIEIVTEMEEEFEGIEAALECLSNHGLKDSDAYWELDAKMRDKKAGIEQLREQIDEQTEDSNDSLAELFS